MFAELRVAIRPALVVLIVLTMVTGIAYPLAITGIAQALLPDRANGSLLRIDGRTVGSSLIGQAFASPHYFAGRPSAAGKGGYDATNSSASNLAPGSRDLRDTIASRVAALRAQHVTGAIPPDLVTASASGLDPDISPEAALVQIPRVAAARRIDRARLLGLVARQTEQPLFGFLGEPRVNVLQLNLALDRMGSSPAP